ncbi:MAG TPA: hypothetical protein VNU26_12590 [Mycobacteriales bacterium]|nr:hypothetical protein [Mycobacteriales bacterium]
MLGAQADGGRGALSALLGAVLVLVFFAAGLVPLLLVRGQEQGRAGLGAGVLLLNYTLRLALAVLVLRAAGRSDAVEPRWTTYAVIASALAWAAGSAGAVLRRDAGPSGSASAE